MKARFWIIVIVIALIVIIVAAASASSGSRRNQNPADLITCTINNDIGIDKIIITNQNTGKSITKTMVDLPYTFNLTEGDTLRLNVTYSEGYIWNAWEINQFPWFAQDNPFTMKVETNLVLNPKCLVR